MENDGNKRQPKARKESDAAGRKEPRRIKAHDDNKRLAEHKQRRLKAYNEEAAATAAPMAEAPEMAATETPDAPAKSSGIWGKLLALAVLMAGIGALSIIIYKGTVGNPQWEEEHPQGIAAMAAGQNYQYGNYAEIEQGALTPEQKAAAQRYAQQQMLANQYAAQQQALANPYAAAIAAHQPVIVYLFNVDSQGVPEKEALTKLANQINPNDMIEIEAYTDPSGSAAYNQALSQRRAQAIANYLVKHGVPASHIIATGCGETNAYPTPQKCRRAEIYVNQNL